MKKNLIKTTIIFLGIGLIFNSCKTSDLDIEAPMCIEQKIDAIINNEVTNPPTQVWRWEVDGDTYYYITSDCCDQYNYLYNEQCEIICAPDGGITGAGNGNCPDFTNEIVKTLVWKDNRD